MNRIALTNPRLIKKRANEIKGRNIEGENERELGTKKAMNNF